MLRIDVSQGEAVLLRDGATEIVVRVLGFDVPHGKMRLGFIAPMSVKISRPRAEERRERIERRAAREAAARGGIDGDRHAHR
jgi:hypothetical protein